MSTYTALALLCAVAARRVANLTPVAVMFAFAAACNAVANPLWLRAGVYVAWPGLLLTGMSVGLRRSRASAPRYEPQAIIVGYLLGGIVAAACYVPAHDIYAQALPASRVAAAALVVWLLVRRRTKNEGPRHVHTQGECRAVYRAPQDFVRGPQTWAEAAATIPAVSLAVGAVVGVWPLAQAGVQAVIEAWPTLAHLPTLLVSVAEAIVILLAWFTDRRKMRGDVPRVV